MMISPEKLELLKDHQFIIVKRYCQVKFNSLKHILSLEKYGGLKSPAERLNQFSYNDNWLQNLLISGSMGGFRRAPLNPL